MSLASGAIVWGADQRKLVLGALIKSGGAGSVYHLPSSTQWVAKIYHDSVNRQEYEQKVSAMLELSPELMDLVENGRRYVQIAWPQALLRDDRGRFVGFAMPVLDVQATSELECILQERQARAAGLPTGLGAKITLAANLAAVIAEIHHQGHHVIDLKPVNLRFYPQSLYMAMLDCDGFSIQGRGKRFAAEQITPDYLAPEFQNKTIAMVGEEPQDCFALAVVVFQLLNFGIHPFTGRPTSERVPTDIPGRIAQHCYAYGMTAHRDLSPSPVSGHAMMPVELRLLFDRAFGDSGARRPTAREWAAVLKSYAQRSNQRLMVCIRNSTHQHYTGLACAACARAALIATTAKNAQAAKSLQLAKPMPSLPSIAPNPRLRAAAGSVPPSGLRSSMMRTLGPSARPRVLFPASQVPISLSGLAGWSFGNRTIQERIVTGIILAFFAVWIFIILNQRDPSSSTDWMLRPTAAYHAPAGATGMPPPVVPVQQVPEPVLVANPLPQTPASLALTHSDIHNVIRSMASGDRNAWAMSMSGLRDGASRRPPGNRGMYRLVFEKFVAGVASFSEAERRSLMSDLRRVFGENPNDSETAYELGWISLLGNDRAAAGEWFERAIGADPDHAASWYGLGIVAPDDSQAIGAIATAETLSPDLPDVQKVRDGFPPAMLRQVGIDSSHIAVLQARAHQLAVLASARR